MTSHNYIIGFLKYYLDPANNITYPYLPMLSSVPVQRSTKNIILKLKTLDFEIQWPSAWIMQQI